MEIDQKKRLRQEPVEISGNVLKNESKLCPAGNPGCRILKRFQVSMKIQSGIGEPENFNG